jgi:putative heme-binding domain-containing protein
MSSVNKKNLDTVLLTVLKGSKGPPPAGLIENLLRLAAALGNRSATVTLLKAVGTPMESKYADWQFAALGSLLDSLESRNSSLTQLAKEGDDVKTAVEKLAGLFTAARAAVKETKEPIETRVQALRLVGRGSEGGGDDAVLIANLLVPQVPDEVQAAALAALGRMRDERVPGLLLQNWKGYGPTLRGQALELLSRRDEWQRALLVMLEKQQVPPAEIDAVRRQRLLDHKDQAIRERAIKVFAGGTDPDRQKVIDSYKPVAKLKGDAVRGQAVFTKTCAACHKLAGVGNEVGPDLATLTDKSTEYLLTHILDPNRVVEPRYVAYVAELKSGLSITGVVTAETGNSITLVGPDGKPQTILRTALESLASSGKSPMPVGLEKDIPHEAMADLLAFLRGASPVLKRKVFEGNNPETIKTGADGSLKLSAQTCAIYGTSLVFEKPYANLGYWSNVDDHAVWTVAVPKTGRYEVSLEYACQNGTAGNTLVLQAGDEKVTWKVVGTGSWDDYKQAQIGTLALSAGEGTISLRSAGPIRGGALLDLKAVRLVPVK